LRLVDPGDAKAFQRLDRIRGVVLHAAEDNDAVARCFDLIGERSESAAEAERGELALDQAF